MNGSEGSSLSATFEILSPRDLMYSVAMSDGLVRIGLESLGWKCGELTSHRDLSTALTFHKSRW